MKVYKFIDGEIALWAEPDGPIMIKAISPHADPVEMNEATELMNRLELLIEEIST